MSKSETTHEKRASTRTVSEAAGNIRRGIKDTVSATGEFVSLSRDAAVEAAKKKINDLEAKWHDIQLQARPRTEEAKVELLRAKDEMNRVLAEVKIWVIETKDAGAGAWRKRIQPALDASLKKAQAFFDQAAARFKRR